MVVDASVILKWFIKEVDSDKAGKIKKDHINGFSVITLPDIALYEIGNALGYKAEFSTAEVNLSLNEIYELNMDIITPTFQIISPVTEIARHYDITFYDAFYIALAKEL
ncbi:MAG: type II toxin-antitoxin system VapC family toxin, partial [Candidatus Omnitrophota bacterium]